MAWLDNYRQASYKNIKFVVPSHSLAGGKRGKLWQYPYQSTPYFQRMGNNAKKFILECYIVGEDYMDQRDKLIEALDKDENGKLVHPYYGNIIVDVRSYSFREIWQETRMVRFTLDCVEAGELQFPKTKIDTTNATELKKESSYDSLISAFEDAYDIISSPQSVIQNVMNNIDKSLDVIEAAKTTVSAVAEYKKVIDNMRGRLIYLTYNSLELVQNITELTQFGTNYSDENGGLTIANSEENFYSMIAIMDFIPNVIINSDPLSPDNLFNSMFQLSGTISACTLLTIMEFDNYESMLEFRDIALNKLDYFLETTQDDILYNELYDLRALVVRDLEIRSEILPRLSQLVLTEHLPAIVLSHNLYLTVNYEEDLIKRNDILNPMFMPAQVELEVLTFE